MYFVQFGCRTAAATAAAATTALAATTVSTQINKPTGQHPINIYIPNCIYIHYYVYTLDTLAAASPDEMPKRLDGIFSSRNICIGCKSKILNCYKVEQPNGVPRKCLAIRSS